MYIDDGLLFPNTEEELKEALGKLERALGSMRVELAPDKSRLHTTKSLITESIKFLGMRFQKRGFFTISSDTRRGTRKETPKLDQEDMLRLLETMLAEKMITVSKYKYAKWTITRSRLGELFKSEVIDVAIKNGFIGYLISWLYNPEKDFEALRAKIDAGIIEAKGRIEKNSRSLSAQVLKQSSWTYSDSHGYIKHVAPDLYNHSTICIDLLLREHHK